MIWANFLHFYQPATQKRYWVDRITDESYKRILNGLKANTEAKITINIAAVLLELWEKFGHEDVIEGYRRLVQSGQVEVTGSAKFHPLLPKLPEGEIIRQIALNELTLFKYLGVVGPVLGISKIKDQKSKVTLKGFFPPEMAFDERVAAIVSSLGYEWVVCEELSFSRDLGKLDHDRIYSVQDEEPGLKKDQPFFVFFRDRLLSFKILSGQLGTPKLFLNELGDRVGREGYLLTAMDGETFGHHRPGMEKLLFGLYESGEIKTVAISQLSGLFRKTEKAEILPATWALMEKDLELNIPFARWDDPDNEIHKMQWELTDLAIKAVQSVKLKEKSLDQDFQSQPELIKNSQLRSELYALNFEFGEATDGDSQRGADSWSKARALLDEAIHSDQYWWASARPWWSLEMIERGARELLEVIRTLCWAEEAKSPVAPNNRHLFNPVVTTPGSRIWVARAWSLYLNIVITGFDWQRTGRVEAMSRKEDEEIRMRTDAGLARIDPAEIKKMVKVLKKEMEMVAENREFERAAQLRDRIKELESYL